jgi:hypothetical protein
MSVTVVRESGLAIEITVAVKNFACFGDASGMQAREAET